MILISYSFCRTYQSFLNNLNYSENVGKFKLFWFCIGWRSGKPKVLKYAAGFFVGLWLTYYMLY